MGGREALSDNFLNQAKHLIPVRIARVWFARRGLAVGVLYTVEGDTASVRAPRAQCEHLDALPDDEIRARLRAWKRKHNKTEVVAVSLPKFYDAAFEHALSSFLRETAQPTVVDAYISYLRRIVLPWLHQHAHVDNLSQFEPETKAERRALRAAIPKLAEHIDSRLRAPSTRIQCRLALRRFSDFLVSRRGVVLDLALLPKIRKRQTAEAEETVLPGDTLPSREDVCVYLRKLPPSREAFVLLCMATFGLRYGEALAFRAGNLKNGEAVSTGILKSFVEEKKVHLAVHVKEAQKRNNAHRRTPKKGEYHGAALSKPLARFLIDCLKSDDWKAHASEIPGEYFKTHVSLRRLLANAPSPLNLYAPHDFRRWSVTCGRRPPS